MAYYQCSKVLKMRRAAMGNKRDDFDVEGPSGMTVYRLEESRHMGTERTYRRLTRCMGLEESLGQGILKTADMDNLVGMNEIMRSIKQKQFCEAEELIESIKDKIDTEVPRNKQYIIAKHAELQFQQNLITAAEYEKRIKEALACTVLSFNEKGVEGWPLHDEELVLIVALNNVYKAQKKYEEQKRLAISVRKCLEQEYLNSELRIRHYVISSIALADALGSMGCHRDAIKVDYETISLCKEMSEFRNIEHAYYDIHWNYWKIKEKETLTEAEESECYQCLLQAYFINKAKGNENTLYEQRLNARYPNALGTN